MRIIVFAFMLLVGCKTLEQKCLERFPTESDTVITKKLRTDTILLADTWIEYLDTTECLPSSDTVMMIKWKRKYFPPDTIFHETMCVDTCEMFPDAEKVRYLIEQLNIQKAVNQEKKQSNRNLIFGLIGLGALAGLMTFLWIRSAVRKKN